MRDKVTFEEYQKAKTSGRLKDLEDKCNRRTIKSIVPKAKDQAVLEVVQVEENTVLVSIFIVVFSIFLAMVYSSIKI